MILGLPASLITKLTITAPRPTGLARTVQRAISKDQPQPNPATHHDGLDVPGPSQGLIAASA
jgi:hypothetical protein